MKKLFSTKNRLLSLALSLALLIAAVFPGKAFAAEAEDNPGISGAYAMLGDEDLFINEEVAYYLAQFFVTDMFNTGTTEWEEVPEITQVVPMYDETGENITAYTAELTQGYVVVSAYVDMPSPILEWAAEGEPYYKQFEEQATYSCLRSTESQVIYLGGLSYLLDIGDDTVVDVQGDEIPREELNNPLNDLRSEENVDDELLTKIVLAKDEAGISPLLNGEGGNKEDEISNPFTFAKNVFYRTNWTCKEFKNYWGGLY